jgi:hypothetical protein
MSIVSNIESQFVQFIHGLWGHESRRRIIIQRWFAGKPNNDIGVRSVFTTFISSIIKDPISFKLDLEKIWFFEDENLALPLSWLSKNEREFLATLVGNSYVLFGEVVDLPSGDFVLQKSASFDKICNDCISRLLILRDFALILVDKSDPKCGNPRPELFLHLLISVRTLITFAYCNDDFSPKIQWTKRLLIFNKVLKSSDVRRNLNEIEILF